MKFNLPPFFYVKAFWESLSLFLAGILGLLVVLGKLSPEYALGSAAIYSWFLSILSLFNINPQVVELLEKRALLSKNSKKAK